MFEAIFSWNALYILLMVIYIPSCIGLIIIVLLQKGKSMGFAGAFGVNPGGDTVLGPRASRSLPVRMTYFMAAAFMLIALSMSIIEGRRRQGVAPMRVDEVETTATQQLTDELDALGVGQEGEAGAPEGMIDEAAPVDEAATVEGAEVEPEAVATDSSEETPAAAEVETMPDDDV